MSPSLLTAALETSPDLIPHASIVPESPLLDVSTAIPNRLATPSIATAPASVSSLTSAALTTALQVGAIVLAVFIIAAGIRYIVQEPWNRTA